MKTSAKNMNTYMAHHCASASTTFSVDPAPTPTSEIITNDKTPKTRGIKISRDGLLDTASNSAVLRLLELRSFVK